MNNNNYTLKTTFWAIKNDSSKFNSANIKIKRIETVEMRRYG